MIFIFIKCKNFNFSVGNYKRNEKKLNFVKNAFAVNFKFFTQFFGKCSTMTFKILKISKKKNVKYLLYEQMGTSVMIDTLYW